tara:strand:+ start:174 stop:503 length:330 start_codon:yes stop_codon:yes gene_type:complete
MLSGQTLNWIVKTMQSSHHVLKGDEEMTSKFKILTPVLVLIAAPAFAQEMDAAIDVNGDGMYSFPELQAVDAELTEDAFTVMDVNGDGLLDGDEVAAATDAGLMPMSDG